MAIVYVDESGDLGLRGSQFFVLTAVLLSDEKTIKEFLRIPKRIRQRPLRKTLRSAPELKFSNSSPVLRDAFIRRAATADISIFTTVIEKQHIPSRIRDDLPFLYQYAIKQLFDDVVVAAPHSQELTIVFDACLSRTQQSTLEFYLRTQLYSTHQRLPSLRFSHENSQADPGLQVTDFIAGAFGHKYNTRGPEREQYVLALTARIVKEKRAFLK